MKPSNLPITYKVIDDDENVLLLRKHRIPNQGVISDQYEIHSDVKQSTWRIEVSDEITVSERKIKSKLSKENFTKHISHNNFIIKGERENYHFEIDVYKLPKFKVQIVCEPFVLLIADGFQVKVKAT